MNKISSFRLKQEQLRRYQTKLIKIKEVSVEAQVEGVSNSRIFRDETDFHVFTPTK